MLRSHRFCVLCAVVGAAVALLFLLSAPRAAAQAPAKGPVSFINDVAPILKENCFACHDAKKRKGKLDMTTYESFRKGGDHDDPVVPGKPEESYILDLLTGKDNLRMPPKEPEPSSRRGGRRTAARPLAIWTTTDWWTPS